MLPLSLLIIRQINKKGDHCGQLLLYSCVPWSLSLATHGNPMRHAVVQLSSRQSAPGDARLHLFRRSAPAYCVFAVSRLFTPKGSKKCGMQRLLSDFGGFSPRELCICLARLNSTRSVLFFCCYCQVCLAKS